MTLNSAFGHLFGTFQSTTPRFSALIYNPISPNDAMHYYHRCPRQSSRYHRRNRSSLKTKRRRPENRPGGNSGVAPQMTLVIKRVSNTGRTNRCTQARDRLLLKWTRSSRGLGERKRSAAETKTGSLSNILHVFDGRPLFDIGKTNNRAAQPKCPSRSRRRNDKPQSNEEYSRCLTKFALFSLQSAVRSCA